MAALLANFQAETPQQLRLPGVRLTLKGETMPATLIDQWTEEVHREFHKQTDLGLLSKDCERCRHLALRLLQLQAVNLVETGLVDAEQLSFTRERLAN